MFKNGMRPVHPGEVLREDYLVPLNMSANALARALNVPAPRINDIVRERRGITAKSRTPSALYRAMGLTNSLPLSALLRTGEGGLGVRLCRACRNALHFALRPWYTV